MEYIGMTTGKKNRGGKWNHESQGTLDAGLGNRIGYVRCAVVWARHVGR